MPKIVDICFITGRRRQAIEEEKANPILTVERLARMLAEHRHAAWLKAGGNHKIFDFKSWVTHINKDPDIKKIFEADWAQEKIWDELKSYGETVPSKKTKKEVSLEQQILDLLNDGWELKGEITKVSDSNKWLQTLVKYENNTEDDLLELHTPEPDKKSDGPTLNIIE